MRWHELGVQTDGQVYTGIEVFYRHCRDRDERGRVLHALSVLYRPEDVDGLVVGRAESFKTLIALLTVVETRSHAMDAKEWVFHKLRWGPFPTRERVVRLDVAIDC